MPTVSFMMGGNGSYAPRGIVYVSTDGGETWSVLDYLSARKPDAGETPEPASGSGYGSQQLSVLRQSGRNDQQRLRHI